MKLDGTETLTNLKQAFEAESAAGVMYRWCAQQADVEGYPEAAKRFEALAEAQVGQALGHLEYLSYVGDPVSGAPIGDTADNFAAAVAAEQLKHDQLYAAFAETARAEGLDEIAEWLESVGNADAGHATKFSESAREL